ncbi:hypothetical protein BB560_003030 [Smittium megazygosporum]|uniref:DH domain-containing protein n=1 Tax=Smittium megazygosporum TaxID=133381 RepID=A0A2T9ZD37_9FUNG|nr:hypothetical protein BB560_003030 [Smittium megazygosporum]
MNSSAIPHSISEKNNFAKKAKVKPIVSFDSEDSASGISKRPTMLLKNAFGSHSNISDFRHLNSESLDFDNSDIELSSPSSSSENLLRSKSILKKQKTIKYTKRSNKLRPQEERLFKRASDDPSWNGNFQLYNDISVSLYSINKDRQENPPRISKTTTNNTTQSNSNNISRRSSSSNLSEANSNNQANSNSLSFDARFLNFSDESLSNIEDQEHSPDIETHSSFFLSNPPGKYSSLSRASKVSTDFNLSQISDEEESFLKQISNQKTWLQTTAEIKRTSANEFNDIPATMSSSDSEILSFMKLNEPLRHSTCSPILLDSSHSDSLHRFKSIERNTSNANISLSEYPEISSENHPDTSSHIVSKYNPKDSKNIVDAQCSAGGISLQKPESIFSNEPKSSIPEASSHIGVQDTLIGTACKPNTVDQLTKETKSSDQLETQKPLEADNLNNSHSGSSETADLGFDNERTYFSNPLNDLNLNSSSQKSEKSEKEFLGKGKKLEPNASQSLSLPPIPTSDDRVENLVGVDKYNKNNNIMAQSEENPKLHSKDPSYSSLKLGSIKGISFFGADSMDFDSKEHLLNQPSLTFPMSIDPVFSTAASKHVSVDDSNNNELSDDFLNMKTPALSSRAQYSEDMKLQGLDPRPFLENNSVSYFGSKNSLDSSGVSIDSQPVSYRPLPQVPKQKANKKTHIDSFSQFNSYYQRYSNSNHDLFLSDISQSNDENIGMGDVNFSSYGHKRFYRKPLPAPPTSKTLNKASSNALEINDLKNDDSKEEGPHISDTKPPFYLNLDSVHSGLIFNSRPSNLDPPDQASEKNEVHDANFLNSVFENLQIVKTEPSLPSTPRPKINIFTYRSIGGSNQSINNDRCHFAHSSASIPSFDLDSSASSISLPSNKLTALPTSVTQGMDEPDNANGQSKLPSESLDPVSSSQCISKNYSQIDSYLDTEIPSSDLPTKFHQFDKHSAVPESLPFDIEHTQQSQCLATNTIDHNSNNDQLENSDQLENDTHIDKYETSSDQKIGSHENAKSSKEKTRNSLPFITVDHGNENVYDVQNHQESSNAMSGPNTLDVGLKAIPIVTAVNVPKVKYTRPNSGYLTSQYSSCVDFTNEKKHDLENSSLDNMPLSHIVYLARKENIYRLHKESDKEYIPSDNASLSQPKVFENNSATSDHLHNSNFNVEFVNANIDQSTQGYLSLPSFDPSLNNNDFSRDFEKLGSVLDSETFDDVPKNSEAGDDSGKAHIYLQGANSSSLERLNKYDDAILDYHKVSDHTEESTNIASTIFPNIPNENSNIETKYSQPSLGPDYSSLNHIKDELDDSCLTSNYSAQAPEKVIAETPVSEFEPPKVLGTKNSENIYISEPHLDSKDNAHRKTLDRGDCSSSFTKDELKRMKMRCSAIRELYSTEASYSRDLGILLEVFYDRINSVDDKNLTDIIFGNIYDVAAVTTRAISMLEALLTPINQLQALGKEKEIVSCDSEFLASSPTSNTKASKPKARESISSIKSEYDGLKVHPALLNNYKPKRFTPALSINKGSELDRSKSKPSLLRRISTENVSRNSSEKKRFSIDFGSSKHKEKPTRRSQSKSSDSKSTSYSPDRFSVGSLKQLEKLTPIAEEKENIDIPETPTSNKSLTTIPSNTTKYLKNSALLNNNSSSSETTFLENRENEISMLSLYDSILIGVTYRDIISELSSVMLQYSNCYNSSIKFLQDVKARRVRINPRIPKNSLLKITQLFKIILECQNDPRTRRLDFESFLFVPIQRLTRIPLLLKTILKYTPTDNNDSAELSQSILEIEQILSEIDKHSGIRVNEEEMVRVKHRIESSLGFNGLFNISGDTELLGKRRFILEGLLFKSHPSVSLYGYLFNDVLILAIPVSGRTDISHKLYCPPIELCDLVVRRSNEEGVTAHFSRTSFEIYNVSTQKSLKLKAQSKESASAWVTQLSAASDYCYEKVYQTLSDGIHVGNRRSIYSREVRQISKTESLSRLSSRKSILG